MEDLKTRLIIKIKKPTKATAAQFAFALTSILSNKTIKKIGTENDNKNFVWKLNVIFLILKIKITKRKGPSINVCEKINSNPWYKFIIALSKPAFSDVCKKVIHPTLLFQIILGNKTNNKEPININKLVYL